TYRDTQILSRLPHRSFERVEHSQLSGQSREIFLRTLEPHGGGARKDAKRFDAGEICDHFLGEAITEVLIRLVRADVRERQHDEGGLATGCGLLGGLLYPGSDPSQLVPDVERRLDSLPRIFFEATSNDAVQVGGEVGANAHQRWRGVAEDR